MVNRNDTKLDADWIVIGSVFGSNTSRLWIVVLTHGDCIDLLGEYNTWVPDCCFK